MSTTFLDYWTKLWQHLLSVKLGCHLAKCPKREGRDYLMHLYQKTLDKKEGKGGKKQCPKCKKKLLRLETHL